MNFKKIIIIALIAISCLALLLLVIDRYPLIEMVISTKQEYTKEKTPGMYVIPDIKRQLFQVSCMIEENKVLKIGHFNITIPKKNIGKINDLSREGFSPAFRVQYNDGKTLMIIPGVPDMDILLTENKRVGKDEKYNWFIKKNNLSTQKDLVSYVLNMSPSYLSIFDDPLTMISKKIALSFKYSMVPIDTTIGYAFGNNNLTGYYIGDDRTVYIHFFDKEGRHYQLRFHDFNENEIKCILNNIHSSESKVSDYKSLTL